MGFKPSYFLFTFHTVTVAINTLNTLAKKHPSPYDASFKRHIDKSTVYIFVEMHRKLEDLGRSEIIGTAVPHVEKYCVPKRRMYRILPMNQMSS